jgi:cysteine desulfurase/selenocysteine lyase
MRMDQLIPTQSYNSGANFSYASEFPQQNDLFYLNHAAVSPWPARTARAVCAFAQENASSGARHYPQWLQREKLLRERLARITGASSTSEIALLKNTSEGLSIIAFGLDWREGDEIIISDQEFPSNRVVWKVLELRFGVKVREVDLSTEVSPEAALLAAITPRTRLLSISSVQYGSGLLTDLASLGQALHKKGILFCVDAIQSLGAMPCHAEENHIDFLVADGHKWMLGPEGLAVLYVRACHIESLQLNSYGWHMLAGRGNYEIRSLTPATDATRFECGSPNMLGIMALESSLSLLEEIGLQTVQAAIVNNTAELAERLQRIPGVDILTDRRAGRHLGILTFRTAAPPPFRRRSGVDATRGYLRRPRRRNSFFTALLYIRKHFKRKLQ